MQNSIPNKSNYFIKFGNIVRKKALNTKKSDNPTNYHTEYEYKGYEMNSYITFDLNLKDNYPYEDIYKAVSCQSDCIIRYHYTFSEAHLKDIYKTLRTQLIEETNIQAKEILPNAQLTMTNVLYHCDTEGSNFGNNMVYRECTREYPQEYDSEISSSYIEIINQLISIDMAPEQEFRDEIIVEYDFKM